jgi:hypothetical protein
MSEMEMCMKTTNYTLDGRSGLSDVIQALGLDPVKISVEDLQGVADRLSKLANKQPGWKWRYLRSVLNHQIVPSKKLVDAMMRLGAVIDSTPEDLAKSVRTMVQAVGRVRPGALVLADSKPCANPGCRMEFVPRTPNQICHSVECAKIYRRLMRHARSEQATKKAKG